MSPLRFIRRHPVRTGIASALVAVLIAALELIWQILPSRPDLEEAFDQCWATSPDGKYLVGHKLHDLIVCDLATGAPVQTLPSGDRPVCLEFSPDDSMLAVAEIIYPRTLEFRSPASPSVQIFNLVTGEERTIDTGFKYGIRSMSFSRNGDQLAAAAFEELAAPARLEAVKIWDTNTGREHVRIEGDGQTVAINLDAGMLAVASDNRIRFHNLASGTCWAEMEPLPGIKTANLYGLGLSRDGRSAVTRQFFWPPRSHVVKLWELHPDQGTVIEKGSWPGMGGAVIAPVGDVFAVLDAQFTLSVRDMATGQTLMETETASTAINAISLAPDGKRVAVATMESGLGGPFAYLPWGNASTEVNTRVYDNATAKMIGCLPNVGVSSDPHFSADGRFIISGGCLWHVPPHKPISEFLLLAVLPLLITGVVLVAIFRGARAEHIPAPPHRIPIDPSPQPTTKES